MARISIIALAIFATTTAQGAALRGGSDGGGGVGVICDSFLPITELLDLHEARRHGIAFIHEPKSVYEGISLFAQLHALHEKLPGLPYDTYFVKNVEAAAELNEGRNFRSYLGDEIKVSFVPELPLSQDIGHYDLKPGCWLKQVAYFSDDDNTLRVAEKYWLAMPALDRAALIAHEFLYLMDRHLAIESLATPDLGHTSERTRRAVATLFSDQGLAPKFEGVPESPTSFACVNYDLSAKPGYFYGVDSGNGEFTAVFKRIEGYGSLYQMKAAFPGFSQQLLQDTAKGEGSANVALTFTGEENAPMFRASLVKKKGAIPELQVFVQLDGAWTPVSPSRKLQCN